MTRPLHCNCFAWRWHRNRFCSCFFKSCQRIKCNYYWYIHFPLILKVRKKKEGDKALKEAESSLNAFIVIPNEKIFKLVELNTPFNEALDVVNNHLARSLQGLLNTIYSSGLINIDWADIKTTIKGTNKKPI